MNIRSFECWFLPMVAYALNGFCGWRIAGFCCGWRIDGAFCGCFYDELLRGGGARLVEMCCDSCEVAPRGLTGRRQRCGLDEKRSERPTSCMDHRGSGPRHRRVDFVALVCYRTLGRLCARRQAFARRARSYRGLLQARRPQDCCSKRAADRSTAPTTWGHEGSAAHKTSSETPPRTKRAARRRRA